MSSSRSTSASSSDSTPIRERLGRARPQASAVRRLDWRFLLPWPDPPPYRMVLLGADPSLLAEARAAGLARTLLDELPSSGTVDAIAVLQRARARVADVSAFLAPGGVVYWEVDRLRHPALTPSALRSRLEKRGVDVLDVYWVGPGFRRANAYVSLGAEHALGWYARSMFVPRTLARSIGVRALGKWTSWRPDRLGWGARRYAVVAGRYEGPRATPTVFEVGVEPEARAPQVVMLMGGEGDWSRVTLLPFEPDGREPARVVKAARRPAFGSSIETEQGALAEVRTLLGPGLRDSVPEPLGSYVWNGTMVGAEGFVSGRSMGISLADHRSAWADKLRDLRDAAGWLAEMHSRTLVGRDPWSRAWSAEMVGGLLRRYESVFGLREPEARLFEETLRASEALEGIPFPRARWHRDFQPTNVFRDGKTIRVVDWEVSTVGPVLIDLVYFILHWAWRSCGARTEDARRDVFRELFVTGTGRAALAARDEIARYRERLEVDARYVPIFVLVTMVALTLDRCARMKAMGDPDWDERGGNPHAGYVGLLAEVG